MANYSNLKTAIENAVDWNNGDNEITGQNLLDILETIIDSLGAKYKFADVATPSSSISTPDEPLFYLAGAGTYANFSGLTVSVQRGTLAIFYYDTAWHWTSVRTDSDAFFNVNQYLEAPSTTYTKATGRNAVPEALRSKGMIITYLTTNGWIIEQNLSTSGTWNADANWQTIGPVSVSQNTGTKNYQFEVGANDYYVANGQTVESVEYELGAFRRILNLTQGQSLNPVDSILHVAIKTGDRFTIQFVGDATKTSKITALYSCDIDGGNRNSIASNINLNTEITLTAESDINFLCVYIVDTSVVGTQDINFLCNSALSLKFNQLKNEMPLTIDAEIGKAIGEFEKLYNLTQGQDVYSADSVFPVFIKQGEQFSIKAVGETTKVGRILSLYSCDSHGGNTTTLKSPVQLNEDNIFIADEDISYLSVYIVGNEIYSDTELIILCKTGIAFNSNDVPEIKTTVERIEPIVDELDRTVNGEIIESIFNGEFNSSGIFVTPLPSNFSVRVGDVIDVALSDIVNIDNNTYVYLMNNNTPLSSGVRAASITTLTAHTAGIVNGIQFYKGTSAGLSVSGKITIPVNDGLLKDFKNFNVIDHKITQPEITVNSLQDFMFDIPYENVNENDRFVLDISSLDNPIWAYLIYSSDKTQNQVYHNIIVTKGKYVFEGFLGDKVFGLRIYCPRTSTAEIAFTLTRLNIKERMQSEINELFGDVVPVYYRRPATLADDTTVNDYLYEKSRTIQTAVANAMPNGDAFVFITDIHDDNAQNQMKSPMLIKYLQKRCNIPRLFNCGDDGGGPVLEVNQKLRQAMSSNKVFTIAGNHDFMLNATYGDVFYSQNMFAEDAVFGSEQKNYFYVDNPQQKIRYIILATYGTDNGTVIEIMGADHFDETQLLWFTSTALNSPQGYSIIVFAHNIYGIDNTSEAVTLDAGEKRYVDAIISHNANSDEKVIVVFDGHAHRDRIINLSSDAEVYQSSVRDNTTVPCIVTTCDKNVPYAGIVNDMNITDRAAGTIREQAFDVVVIDKSSKTVKCIRIGCEALDGIGGSSDRTPEQNSGEPTEIREVSYP